MGGERLERGLHAPVPRVRGPGRTSLTFEPTYSLHSLIPRIAGTRTVTAAARRAICRSTSMPPFATIASERPEIVIVCSPNNPTGGCESLCDGRGAARGSPGPRRGRRGLRRIRRTRAHASSPARAVIRTSSSRRRSRKRGGSRGSGSATCWRDPALIAELARVRLPYHLSAITQLVGVAAIRHATRDPATW